MTLLPFRRPTVGLCIRAHSLTAVEVSRDWRTGWRSSRLRSVAERVLPAGLVRPSATELNITDVGKLADQIEGLLDRDGPTPVALSLPDLCARTALFEFDTLPTKAAEREALLRWRFQKDFNLATESGRLLYRIYPAPLPGTGRFRAAGDASHPPNGTRSPARVLAVAMRRNVMEEYEHVCDRAHIIPLRIGLPSLALFDLCHPVLEQWMTSRSATGSGMQSDEYFFVSVSDDSFSLLAIRHGVPSFVRMKSRNGASADSSSSSGAAALIPKATLADEVVATLQFYDESVGSRSHDQRPLFIVGVSDEPDRRWLAPEIERALGVELVPVRPEHFSFYPGNRAHITPPSGMAAVAGLFAA
jgi:hypothetical protein